uniref:Reverse transcriptase zinc-binding domain-containing protein n=1 Tax=Aegilops tauschii subsp. strangulata TaxID=200361 RepID=A0A452YYY1_AEGTS
DHDETIQHLFLECPLAKLLWRTIHIAFNINPPVDIASLFGTWLARVEQITAARIRIGICALLWAIWNCRNDMIFNRQHTLTFLQVIFGATAWICTWSLLTHMDSRELLVTRCNQWKMVARVIFNRFG